MPTTAGDHGAWRDDLPAYVLGALSSAEREALAAHLAGCAECAAEARALAPLVDALGQAVPQVDPPAALRARVLQAIVGDARSAPAPSRVEAPAAPAMGWAPWLLAAASLVLAIALGAEGLRLRREVGAVNAQLRDAAAQAETRQRALADLRRRADEAQRAMAILTATDVAPVVLAGQPAAPTASARAFVSPSRGLVITAANLPPLPAGRIYQLWIIAGATPVSAGLLQPSADGRVDAVLPAPALPSAPNVLAVTIEPAGGVAAPTGDKYLVGTVRRG